MDLVRFYACIIRLGLALAAIGMLKNCTLQLLHLSAAKTEAGIISYSKFSHALTH
jgi:hypothetical protein